MSYRQKPGLMRIYERLRKRSWRAWGGFHSYYHEMYLQGVKDALKAVDLMVSEPLDRVPQ